MSNVSNRTLHPREVPEVRRSAVHLGAVVRVGQVLPLGSMFPD
jgi:hypothetical protein